MWCSAFPVAVYLAPLLGLGGARLSHQCPVYTAALHTWAVVTDWGHLQNSSGWRTFSWNPSESSKSCKI